MMDAIVADRGFTSLELREVLPSIGLWPTIFKHGDPFIGDYEANKPDAANHYGLYIGTAKELRPKSILEIGVRAGYSAWCLLSGSPDASYHGIDLNLGTWGGEVGYTEHAKEMLAKEFPKAELSFQIADSQTLIQLPSEHYDLIHIDGAHDFDSALRDLKLCAPYADWIIIDDTGFIPSVRDAVDRFVTEYSVPGWRYDSWRGLVVLDVREIRELPVPAVPEVKPKYYPHLFICNTVERARQVILTPDKDLDTDTRWENETAWLAKRIQFAPGLVIDFGCGIGRVAKCIASAENQVLGIDISPTMRGMAESEVQSPWFGAVTPIMANTLIKAGVRASGGLAIWALQHVHTDDLLASIDMLAEAIIPGGLLFTLDNGRLIPVTMAERFGWGDDNANISDLLMSAGFMLHESTRIPEDCASDGLFKRWVRRRK